MWPLIRAETEQSDSFIFYSRNSFPMLHSTFFKYLFIIEKNRYFIAGYKEILLIPWILHFLHFKYEYGYMVCPPRISGLRYRVPAVYWWLQTFDAVRYILRKCSQYALTDIIQKPDWSSWKCMMVYHLNPSQITGRLADIILICFYTGITIFHVFFQMIRIK